MMIIYASNAQQYIVKNSKYLKLEYLTFGGKISRLKEVLVKFHPDLVVKYSMLFDNLNTFKKFRDKMAHCSFEWEYSTVKFDIIENVEDETGFQYYKAFPYSVVQARLATVDGAALTVPLLQLSSEIELRLKNHHPNVYASLGFG